MQIDDVQLQFNPENLFILNLCLGFIMFGVALDIQIKDFKTLLKNPTGAILGIISQFIALPLLTLGLVLILDMHPSFALGLILVSACPGGNISNFITSLSKGNTALSVLLTSIGTVMAMFMTPLNFKFYSGIFLSSAPTVTDIEVDIWGMVKVITLVIGIPLILGVYINERHPKIKAKIFKTMRVASLVIFTGFVVIALINNWQPFKDHLGKVIWIVLLHNFLALLMGYSIGLLGRRKKEDCRTLSIETGIQNAGLALVIIFTFFDGRGGMAIIAAWWAVWHILSGLVIATFWGRIRK